MENKKNLVFFGVLATVFAVYKIFKKPKLQNPTPGPDWTYGGASATITVKDAEDIRNKIQAQITYLTVNWGNIAKQFERLRNDRDVELLFKIWGVWDGPKLANGNLFEAIHRAYTPFLDDNNVQSLTTIKKYSFSYGKNWKFRNI